MIPETTPAVARALRAAQALALADRSAEVGTLHLLHGLLIEEEGRAASLLIEAGLDWPAYRRLAVVPSAEPADSVIAIGVKPREVLAHAVHLARELTGEPTIDSESVLFALIEKDLSIRGFLAPLGLDATTLEQKRTQERSPPPSLEEPLVLPERTDEIDLGRVLDASANRAREGLRVVEDYCRFVLDDSFLCRELKRLRHELTEALTLLPHDLLLEARETQFDVGTAISTESEQARGSPTAVATANCKRLQEALRSLEEFGKVYRPELGSAIEQIRYRSYTLERAIVLGRASRSRLAHAQLYVLLSTSQCSAAIDWTIEEAAAGGAQIVQLREKDADDRQLLGIARRACAAARRAGIIFIVNDRPDIARLVGADGVHLGQDDMPVKEARRIIGSDALIGVSTHAIEQVRQAVLDGANYLGIGPVFPSSTKQFEAFPGLEFAKAALAETSLPAFAIGGINPNTIATVATADVRRVAVSAAIAQADDPRTVAAQLRSALGPV